MDSPVPSQTSKSLDHQAADELASRGKPGWFSFGIGNFFLFIVEPSLASNWIAALGTAINVAVLILKGLLIIRWNRIYPRNPKSAMRQFAVLSATQAANLSILVAYAIVSTGFTDYGFITLMGALACAQAAVVAQCTHVKVMRICLICYLLPAAIGAFSLGGLKGVSIGLLLTIELLFLIYQGTQMNKAYWQALRENRELMVAREQADQASQSKSQFLAKVSHELRTPIHGVMGLTSLVLDTPINDEQRENLETVQHSAAGLLELVNHLLDLSKIESNRVELERVPFQTASLLEQIVKPLRFAAEAKGLEFVCDAGDGGGLTLLGDPLRLRQILINLTGNAIKFTNSGRVAIMAKMAQASNGRVRLDIEVSDTGIGIPADKLTCIFEPFRQADASVAREFGGTGLGLSIAKNLAELMEGVLTVASTPGKGSTFLFTCLFDTLADQNTTGETTTGPARKIQLMPARSLSVLVVDDNPVNRRLAEKQLCQWNHTVVLAEDGSEAVDLASTQKFDLILMDVLMPVLDGTAATEQLRAIGVSTPVIAVTANAQEEQLRDCMEAGMNAVLAKPYSSQQLFEIVERFSSEYADGNEAARPLPA